MNNLERIKITVKHSYPEDKILICKVGEKELLAKAEFEHIYSGDELILYGRYLTNKKLGRYFNVSYYREILNEIWISKWLKISKNLRNNKITDIVVDKKDITKYKTELIGIKKSQKIFQYLIDDNVSREVVTQIEKDYRWNCHELIKDPYQFLQYPKIRYDQVQKIITKFKCGNPIDSKGRYLVENILKKANQSGHYFLLKKEIGSKLKKYDVNFEKITLNERFTLKEDKIYLRSNYEVEKEIAKSIKKRIIAKKGEVKENVIKEWEDKNGFNLAKNQKEAVLMALKEAFCVVTGGPGVGKTTVCKCITDLLGENHSIMMVAPTGRAAKRANESTGLPTSTIHSLLGFNGTTFQKNENNKIETDVLVIDESSMIDTPLLYALLKATPLDTKIVFVGDVDQLPSVGPGQTLKDLIDSKNVPVTRLTEIFRQAADSPIITLAYAVNESKLPELNEHEDLKYIERKNEDELFDICVKEAEKLYKENDIFDVQVLIPMYKGPVGINAINNELQNRLNKQSKAVKVGEIEIRENDKIIQTKNIKEKGIYNGDVGIVTSAKSHEIKVRFQGQKREIIYKRDEFYDLQLSYAITVHRSQGSEYQYVIIPTVESYSVMLQKNLLYTAITRSKKKLWMMYQISALKKAIRQESVPKRHTTLKDMLFKKSTA